MDEITRLLEDAAAGDDLALSGFVHATQADVWRFCAALVDRASADDLTQEVYLHALPSAPRFRGEASARTWLLAIARHVCIDEIRRRQRRRSRPLPRQDESATDPAGLVDLAELVGRLDPDRRAAFVLTQMLGLSYAEAAETCEVPIGTIRSRVARARADLLDELADGDAGGHGAAASG